MKLETVEPLHNGNLGERKVAILESAGTKIKEPLLKGGR